MLRQIKPSNFNIYQFLQRQNNTNYSNAYERILGDLQRTMLPATTQQEFEKRQVALKQLYDTNYAVKNILFPR